MRTRGAARVVDNRLDDVAGGPDVAATLKRLLKRDPIMGPAAVNLATRVGSWQANGQPLGTRCSADTALLAMLVQHDKCMVKAGTSPGVVAGLPTLGTHIDHANDDTRTSVIMGRYTNLGTDLPAGVSRYFCRLLATEGMQQWLANQIASHQLAPLFSFVVKTVRTKVFGAGHAGRSYDVLVTTVAAAMADTLWATRAPPYAFGPGALDSLVELCFADANGASPPAGITSRTKFLVIANMPRAMMRAMTARRALPGGVAPVDGRPGHGVRKRVRAAHRATAGDNFAGDPGLAAQIKRLLNRDSIMGPAVANLATRVGSLQANGQPLSSFCSADTALVAMLVRCDECMVKAGTSPRAVAGLPTINTHIESTPSHDVIVGRYANLGSVSGVGRSACRLPATEGMQQWLANQIASHQLAPLFSFVVKTARTNFVEADHTGRSHGELVTAFAADVVAALVATRAHVDMFRPGALDLMVELCFADDNGASPPAGLTSKIASLVADGALRALADAPPRKKPKMNVASLLARTIDARDVPDKLAGIGGKGNLDLLRTQRSDGQPSNHLTDSPAVALVLAAAGAFKDADPGPYARVEFSVPEVGKYMKVIMFLAGYEFHLGVYPTLEAAKAVRKVLLALPHVLALVALLHRAGAAPAGDRALALAQAEVDLVLPPLTGRLLDWGVARLEPDPEKRAAFVAVLEPARLDVRARVAAVLPRNQFIVVHRKAYNKYVGAFTEATGENECPRCEKTSEFVGATDGKGNKSEVDGPGGKVDVCPDCSFYFNHPEVQRTAEKAHDMFAAFRTKKRKLAVVAAACAPDPEFGFTPQVRIMPRPA